jgi:hypothetical protein
MSPSKIDDLKRDLNQLTAPRGQKHPAPADDRGRDAEHLTRQPEPRAADKIGSGRWLGA